MVPGYNHNIFYKGVAFHIQTEDSGVRNPQITTLLYRGGSIIASKKTDYSDIIMVEMLDKVVEDLMKEQHKDMLRQLKSGEFDNRIISVPEDGSPQETTQESATTSLDTPPAPAPTEQVKKSDSEKTLDEIIFEYLASTKD
jgi:ketol-acid reductoisomerase